MEWEIGKLWQEKGAGEGSGEFQTFLAVCAKKFFRFEKMAHNGIEIKKPDSWEDMHKFAQCAEWKRNTQYIHILMKEKFENGELGAIGKELMCADFEWEKGILREA